MRKVSTHEAKTHLSRLIAEVQEGQEILICRGGRPSARLVGAGAAESARRRPAVGTKTSAPVSYAADAFEPLSDRDLAEWGL